MTATYLNFCVNTVESIMICLVEKRQENGINRRAHDQGLTNKARVLLKMKCSGMDIFGV